MQERHDDVHGFVGEASYNVADRIRGQNSSQADPCRDDPENSGNNLLRVNINDQCSQGDLPRQMCQDGKRGNP